MFGVIVFCFLVPTATVQPSLAPSLPASHSQSISSSHLKQQSQYTGYLASTTAGGEGVKVIDGEKKGEREGEREREREGGREGEGGRGREREKERERERERGRERGGGRERERELS